MLTLTISKKNHEQEKKKTSKPSSINSDLTFDFYFFKCVSFQAPSTCVCSCGSMNNIIFSGMFMKLTSSYAFFSGCKAELYISSALYVCVYIVFDDFLHFFQDLWFYIIFNVSIYGVFVQKNVAVND